MANLSGTLNAFRILVQPRLIVPSLTVKTIKGINFKALRKAGYEGVVFDKDNCLTLPHRDRLMPELKDAWSECKDIFGRDNVLIVSNSAGTRSDPSFIQAESVSHHLGVPVLAHSTKKPGCISQIQKYFAHQRDASTSGSAGPKIVVVGDRLFTDVLMANRMGSSALGIWTTGLWVKESMPMRFVEKLLLRIVLAFRRRRHGKEDATAAQEMAQLYTKAEPSVITPPKPRAWYTRLALGALQSTWTGTRWVATRITEGAAARLARRSKKALVNSTLDADPEASGRVSVWRRFIDEIRRQRQLVSEKAQEVRSQDKPQNVSTTHAP